MTSNPLISDRDLEFQLYDVIGVADRETADLVIDQARRLAREVLYPTYKPMDDFGGRFVDGKVEVHPRMGEIYRALVEVGALTATRPESVGGQDLPLVVYTAATLYWMAANGGALAFAGLSTGAAHLIENFGSDELKRVYMKPMYEGRWTGTMALTEPQAGSSLADVRTRARPTPDGHYLIDGAKMFISGGDQNFSENIVHLTLARIEGAPAGIKGVSLFVIPKRRVTSSGLVDNDVQVAGMIHKIGWRAVPSVALNFGERGDCHGYLVGEPHRGIPYMFQLMNEARLMVGCNGVATASVAYHEALAYARTRTQGRKLMERDPSKPPVPIIEHADVRRMLLRQKAIVEGAIALVLETARLADAGAKDLLDLLTPVAKSFPAERGFESNVLAVQVHGGYGYTTEYLPEAWLRDQKLNSIHEGTNGIQGLDLLGRKVVAKAGGAFRDFLAEIDRTLATAKQTGVDAALIDALAARRAVLEETTVALAQKGLAGDVEGMLLHSADYLELFSIFVVGWLWLRMAEVATRCLADKRTPEAFYRGKLTAARYYLMTEVPRIDALAKLCRDGESSYADMRDDWF